MISINDFKALCDQIKEELTNVKEYSIVAHEGHAMKRLGSKTGIQMLVLLPSADRSGRPGAGIDANVTWFFILEKDDPSQSSEKELAQFQKLQEIILQCRKWIEEQNEVGNATLFKYDPARTHIDSEQNEFGGWNGWSMSIVF